MFGFTKNSFIHNSNEEKTTIVMGGVTPSGGYVQSAWTKPMEARFVCITCIGPGGQGGAGDTVAGGGGGGAGAITSVIYPTMILPQTFYLFAGNSLAGESPGGATGITGYASVVSISPYYDLTSSTSELLCYADGGNPGSSASGAAGALGAATAANIITDAPRMSLGMWQSLGGPAGTAGGVSATAPIAITALAASILSGGTGGSYAGTTQNAAITGAGIIPTIIAPATAPSDAPGGFWSWKPLCGTGGPGGGGGLGTGGKGGNGSYGSGGGGGGRGSVTGGNGGDGGPGIIFVTWW